MSAERPGVPSSVTMLGRNWDEDSGVTALHPGFDIPRDVLKGDDTAQDPKLEPLRISQLLGLETRLEHWLEGLALFATLLAFFTPSLIGFVNTYPQHMCTAFGCTSYVFVPYFALNAIY